MYFAAARDGLATEEKNVAFLPDGTPLMAGSSRVSPRKRHRLLFTLPEHGKSRLRDLPLLHWYWTALSLGSSLLLVFMTALILWLMV